MGRPRCGAAGPDSGSAAAVHCAAHCSPAPGACKTAAVQSKQVKVQVNTLAVLSISLCLVQFLFNRSFLHPLISHPFTSLTPICSPRPDFSSSVDLLISSFFHSSSVLCLSVICLSLIPCLFILSYLIYSFIHLYIIYQITLLSFFSHLFIPLLFLIQLVMCIYSLHAKCLFSFIPSSMTWSFTHPFMPHQPCLLYYSPLKLNYSSIVFLSLHMSSLFFHHFYIISSLNPSFFLFLQISSLHHQNFLSLHP